MVDLICQHFTGHTVRLSSFLLQFVVYGRPIAVGGMQSLAVIKHFNVFKYCLPSFIPITKGR